MRMAKEESHERAYLLGGNLGLNKYTNAIDSKIIDCEPGQDDYFIPMTVLSSPDDSPYTVATNVTKAFQRSWSEPLSTCATPTMRPIRATRL